MTASVDHIHHLDRELPPVGDLRRSMALWVPAERVTVQRIDVPTAPERKWADLIPWILEDRLLQPVDEMHFVVGQTVMVEGKKQVDVAVVSKQDMGEWQRIAENAGIHPTAMVPDYLALPYEPGRISLVWREGMCLVRTGVSSGYGAAPGIAWTLLRRVLSVAESGAESGLDRAPRLSISVPDETLVPEDLRALADINSATIDWPLSDLPLSANLMRGEFTPTVANTATPSWITSAALVLLTLGLGIGYLQFANQQLGQTISDLEQQLQSGFGTLFPGKRTEADTVRTEAERLIAELFRQRESLQAPAMQALIQLEPAMVNCGCDLQVLVASASKAVLEVSNAGSLAVKPLTLPGYQVDKQNEGETTRLTLVAVDRP